MKNYLAIRYTAVILLVVVMFLLSSFSGQPAQHTHAAQIIFVDASAAGANTGVSWADAFTDLQLALAVAGNGDEIWVAAGTYRPGSDRAATFQLISDVTILGGFPAGGGEL